MGGEQVEATHTAGSASVTNEEGMTSIYNGSEKSTSPARKEEGDSEGGGGRWGWE